MMRNGFGVSLLFLTVTVSGGSRAWSDDAQMPPFGEVYEAVQTNLSGISDEELNRAAVQGFVNALHPRVLLANKSEPQHASTGEVRSRVFEDSYGYLRIENVQEGLSDLVRESLKELLASNELKGVIVDLRFSGGEDYHEVAKVANIFVRREHDLLDFGDGMVKSESKWDALVVPVAALVNGGTHSAAEILAGVLRETGAALLIGGKTSGQATVRREVELSGGFKLLLGGAPVKLGDGKPVPAEGLKPDVSVQVDPNRESAYLKDPFKRFAREGGESASMEAFERSRINEADLVREKRGLLNSLSANGNEEESVESERPVVRDPALARALDLLKGLAILKQNPKR